MQPEPFKTETLRVAHALHSFFGHEIAPEILKAAEELVRKGDLATADVWISIAEQIEKFEASARGALVH